MAIRRLPDAVFGEGNKLDKAAGDPSSVVDADGTVGDDGMTLEEEIEQLKLALSRVPKPVKWGQFDLTPQAELVHNNKLLAGWQKTYGEDDG